MKFSHERVPPSGEAATNTTGFRRGRRSMLTAVLGLGALVAVVASGLTTASAVPNALGATTHQGQSKTNGTLGGYTSGNITTYAELDPINFRFTLSATDPGTGRMVVSFTEDGNSCTFFDGTFNLGTHDGSAPAIQPVSGAVPTVSTVGTPTIVSGRYVQELDVSFAAAGEAVVNYFLTLSGEAGDCQGAAQNSRLGNASPTGDFGNIGAQNVPVPANQVLRLPSITVTKQIDRDGDGTFDTAAAGEFCFSLDAGLCEPTDASGQVVFSNVTPDGDHTITETQLDFSQGTFVFDSGTGVNCIFDADGVATATVAAGRPATDASCTFRNVPAPASLTVTKMVNNTHGGTLGAADFDLFVNGTQVTSGMATTLAAGSYVVSETPVAGYTGVITGACDPDGAVTLLPGDNKACTITNSDQPAQLTVIKNVDNAHGGTAVAGDFTMHVAGTNVSMADFAGAGDPGTTVTLHAGAYGVTESGPGGYTASFSADCSGTIAVGETKTCVVTNTQDPIPPQKATITIVKETDPADVGTFNYHTTGSGLSDFTLDFSGPGSNMITFPDLDPGGYSVAEGPVERFFVSRLECDSGTWAVDPDNRRKVDITVAAGEHITCTFTNTKHPWMTIVKNTVPANQGSFGFTTTGPGLSPFTLDFSDPPASNTRTFKGLVTGAFSVTELPTPGWVLSGISCDSGTWAIDPGNDRRVNITLAAGDWVTCTFTNTKTGGSTNTNINTNTPLPTNTSSDPGGNPNGADPDVLGAEVTATGDPEVLATGTGPIPLQELPRTGTTAFAGVFLGGLLVLLGALATLAGRRRRLTTH